MANFDLFISYSSKDRTWAKKLFGDLRSNYPWLRIFWDRESIPAGEAWRKELQSAIENSIHLVVFWSDYANVSLEVGPEIEAFNAHRALTPRLDGSNRKGFYAPLEGNRGGGIGDYQGFDDFRKIYKPQADDRGIGGVATGQGQEDWERMIQMIGDAVSQADQAQEVIAAVAAMRSDVGVELLDQTHGRRSPGTRITLDQLLAGFNLDWAKDVRFHYGLSALAWRPTGGRTIVELLDGVRVRVNANLDAPDRFRWRYVDLTTDEGLDLAGSLHKVPSIVTFDPVSLFDPYCAAAMRRLNRYVLEKQSVILSLSPALKTDEDVYGTCLRELSLPLFNDYFHPEIPPIGEFAARWAPEVQRVAQIERLVRNRIRDLRFAADVAAGKATTGHK